VAGRRFPTRFAVPLENQRTACLGFSDIIPRKPPEIRESHKSELGRGDEMGERPIVNNMKEASMRRLVIASLTGVLLAAHPAAATGELHIYNWPGYTSAKVIEKFSRTYDVKVTVDEYEGTEELLSTLRAGDARYDIVVPTDVAVQILVDEGWLAETRPNQMENFKNVDPHWVDVPWDPGRNYSVPYLWGTTALAVDAAAYKGEADTLKLLFEPPAELQGKIGIVSSAVIEAAWRYLGKPQCSGSAEDVVALQRLLTGARPFWHTLGSNQYPDMASGATAVALVWSGMVADVRRERPTWRYVYPREGFSVWMDNVVVLKAAPNLQNAKLFQSFLMDPENAALNSDAFNTANAIVGSEKFLSPDFGGTPERKLPAGVSAADLIPPLCPADVRAKYDEIWANLTK
jgi:spermidine/putrescine transport system substrate-binding protein